MKIPIKPADAEQKELDTEDIDQCLELLQYVAGLQAAPLDMVVIRDLQKLFFQKLDAGKVGFEGLLDGEWSVLMVLNNRAHELVLAASRLIAAGWGDEDSEGGKKALELRGILKEIYPATASYDSAAAYEELQQPSKDAEDVLYAEFYKATYDVESDDSDSDTDTEDNIPFARKTKLAQRKRGKRRPTYRGDRVTPAMRDVKANMRRFLSKEVDCSVAFRTTKSSFKAELEAVDALSATSTTAERNRAVGGITNILWKQKDWNIFTDENAYICYPPGTWNKELQELLVKVNEALAGGKELPENDFIVAQYRGIAYNKKSFDVVARRKSREAVELAMAIYSPSVFAEAGGISPGEYYAGAFNDDSQRSRGVRQKLADSARRLKIALTEKRNETKVTFAGREYANAALALQNFYTIDYGGFFETLATYRKREQGGEMTTTKEEHQAATDERTKLEKELEQLEKTSKTLNEKKLAAKKATAARDAHQKNVTALKKRIDSLSGAKKAEKVKEKTELELEYATLLTAGEELPEPVVLTPEEAEELKRVEERKPKAAEAFWKALRTEQLLDAIRCKMFDGLRNDSNPLVSTGSTPRHSLRYAYALKFYDSAARDKRLLPEWKDGRARHPYAGKIYVSLHEPDDYLPATGAMDVVALTTKQQIDVPSDIVAEREASFPASIDANRVVAEHIARFPSFQSKYKTAYGEKYGLAADEYENFRRIALKATSAGAMEALLESVGEWLVRYHEARLVELARRLAVERGKILVYRDSNGLLTYMLPKLPQGNSGVRSSAARPSTMALDSPGSDLSTDLRDALIGAPEDAHAATPLVGLLNNYNGCYLNSVVQMLRTVGGAGEFGFARNTWTNPVLADETIALMDRLGNDAADGTYLTRLGGAYTGLSNEIIRQRLKLAARWAYLYSQQDAEEALRFILGAFAQAFNRANPAELAALVEEGTYANLKPSPLHYLLEVKTTFATDRGTRVDERDGPAANWYTLEDDGTRTLLQNAMHVGLSIAGNDATTLAAVWQAAWDRQYGDDEDKTPLNCTRQGLHYKASPRSREVTSFRGNPPDHLFIQLLRFGFVAEATKIATVVAVPAQQQVQGRTYDLKSFIFHLGDTLHGGHYIAYALHNNVWYEANDNVITPNPANLEERRNASYLYYYRGQ